MSSVDTILAKLEELSAKVGYLQADVHGLRQDIDGDREESRRAVIELRSDLTVFVNQFTTAIDDSKKKAIKTPMLSKPLLPKLLRQRT
jgi:hypothetical protein